MAPANGGTRVVCMRAMVWEKGGCIAGGDGGVSDKGLEVVDSWVRERVS